MTSSQPPRTAVRRRPAASPCGGGVAATGITIYGCDPDEEILFRRLAPRFGVRATSTQAPLSEANAALATGNAWVSVSHKARVAEPELVALSRVGVRHISTRSVGCNHIDVGHAATLGISVETVDYSPDGVADYTVMLVLMALRNARSVLTRVETGDYRLGDTRGRELRDLTVGVVGTGRIGAAVMTRLEGFGCRVLAHDIHRRTPAEYLPLDDLLRRSDVVTLHTPLTAATHHLLDRDRIGRLKPGAVVVNTARGALVETGALLDALESGALGGAALDVVEGEEGTFYADRRGRPAEGHFSRLRRLPHVVVSPHTAFHTDRALRDVVENTLVSCTRQHDGARRG